MVKAVRKKKKSSIRPCICADTHIQKGKTPLREKKSDRFESRKMKKKNSRLFLFFFFVVVVVFVGVCNLPPRRRLDCFLLSEETSCVPYVFPRGSAKHLKQEKKKRRSTAIKPQENSFDSLLLPLLPSDTSRKKKKWEEREKKCFLYRLKTLTALLNRSWKRKKAQIVNYGELSIKCFSYWRHLSIVTSLPLRLRMRSLIQKRAFLFSFFFGGGEGSLHFHWAYFNN